MLECIHRPINIRQTVIKTANLGLRHKPLDATPTTAGGSDHNNSVTMDTLMEENSSEVVPKESGNATVTKETNEAAVTKETDKIITSETRTTKTNNSELSYTGSVTMMTAQPAANISGHTGYLTFASLRPRVT